jgi:FixJ family two-component response regulator
MSPTVHLIDDDASVRTSVTRLLRASGFAVRAWSSAEAFLAEREAGSAGCVVTDLEMPAMSGIELQDRLARAEHPLPVVFLTGHGDVPTSVTAMRRGAEDFVTKTAPKEVLLSAVRRALERDVRESRRRERDRELQERLGRLTPRDREVLVHVLRGQLNKEIAAELEVDERSVKRHRTSLMRKLEVDSVVELVLLAREAGMAGSPAPEGALPPSRYPAD